MSFKSLNSGLIVPDWPIRHKVGALITTRDALGAFADVQNSPYSGANLALHVGDDAKRVANYRQRLVTMSKIKDIAWLNQTHSNRVVSANPAQPQDADASFTRESQLGCAVLTADCLPVLIGSYDGSVVAAIHAGWRGLLEGIIYNTVAALGVPERHLCAWLGPAIGPSVFEVGGEVMEQFLQLNDQYQHCFKACIRKDGSEGFMADIYAIARYQLRDMECGWLGGGQYCTFSDPRFYSYRRDSVTGRFASLIWRLNPN